MNPEDALAAAQIHALTAPDLAEAERRVLLEKAAADCSTRDAHTADATGEKDGKMDKSFRKLLIDAGPAAAIRKSFYNDALKALGEELRQAGDTDARAYVRALESAEGRELHELYKRAPADPLQDEVEQVKPAPKGAANLEMDTLAALHRKANPTMSHAAAYTHVLLAPENRELAARVKAEDLASVPRTPAGRRLLYENPNRDADVHRTMARLR